jgi:hypothetical protein
MTMMGQTDKKSNKESWYFKLGGSYFTSNGNWFPQLSGQQPNRDIYVGGISFKRN